MSVRCLSSLFVVLIGAVSGATDLKSKVGDEVSFKPIPTLSFGNTITWKFRSDGGSVIRVIEFDQGESSAPQNSLFKDYAAADKNTGELTLKNVRKDHSGLYYFEINSKEQEQKFTLKVVGVFGDETERVSVNDGGSVTLHTNLTELPRFDVIDWRFNGSRIARIYREFRSDPVYDPDERFTDRLKMNPQTADLTITDITSELTGLYQLVIIYDKPITKSFSVSLSPEVKIVKERDSVTLHIDLNEKRRNDQIHWKIKHNKSPVAEIIRENGKISTPFIEERFRDRLKLDDQTGSLTITHMKNEDSGPYEADVTIGRITHTIHKTFSVTGSGVFDYTVSVNDGGSVTLHTHLTDIQRDDLILWRFKGDLIARINREVNSDPVYEPVERFTDRLKMNPQTVDLTITNITSQHTGLYQLEIASGPTERKFQTFSVSLSPKVKIVKERDSVTLHMDLNEKQRNDQIHWKIKHNNSPVAEIITVNGKISTPFIEERFRGRLKLDDQTGSLTITDMKNEDSGPYEADVTIGRNTHTIHKTFSVTDSAGGVSSGVVAGSCVGVLLVIAAVIVAGVFYHRHRSSRTQEGEVS